MDPKTVLCQFYKQGNCEKGRKCKFSHDLAVERKGEKRNLYQDTRDAEKEREEEERKKDDMAEWDEGTQYPTNTMSSGLSLGGSGWSRQALTNAQRNCAKSSSASTATPKPPPTKSANISSKQLN